MTKVWIVKNLRDLRSGKPETDVTVFKSEARARRFIAEEHAAFKPWNTDDDFDPALDEVTQWCLGDADYPDEYIELECHDVNEEVPG